MKVRTRAWTIFRPEWQDRFELALLPGLEESRSSWRSTRSWAGREVPLESLERGEPIRLRRWKP